MQVQSRRLLLRLVVFYFLELGINYVFRRLGLHWGVTPLFTDGIPSTDETISRMLEAADQAGLVQPGEVVVIIMGTRSNGASDILKIHVA